MGRLRTPTFAGVGAILVGLAGWYFLVPYHATTQPGHDFGGLVM